MAKPSSHQPCQGTQQRAMNCCCPPPRQDRHEAGAATVDFSNHPIHTASPQGPIAIGEDGYEHFDLPEFNFFKECVRSKVGVCVWFDRSYHSKSQWFHGKLVDWAVSYCERVLVEFDNGDTTWLFREDWEQGLAQMDSEFDNHLHGPQTLYYTSSASKAGRRDSLSNNPQPQSAPGSNTRKRRKKGRQVRTSRGLVWMGMHVKVRLGRGDGGWHTGTLVDCSEGLDTWLAKFDDGTQHWFDVRLQQWEAIHVED